MQDVSQRTSLSQYPKYKISQLSPGPVRACFSGIIVNLQHHVRDSNSKAPDGANGGIKLLLKDETGEILVNLWVLDTRYKLKLNALVTAWTTHICSSSPFKSSSQQKANSPPRPSAPISTSLFPERNVACGLRIFRRDSRALSPLEKDMWSRVARVIDGEDIMSLEDFVSGKVTQRDIKLLVCVAEIGKSVQGENICGSPQRDVWRQTDRPYGVAKSTSDPNSAATATAIGLRVIDSSRPQAAVKLVFETPLHESVTEFLPCCTVLLITQPRYVGGQLIVLSHHSRVLVDPDIEVAKNLKSLVEGIFPPCNTPLDEDDVCRLFDRQSCPRTTTLSAFESLISQDRSKPQQAIISVILTSLRLAELFQNQRLFCMPCPECAVATFSNHTKEDCQSDPRHELVDLRLNPQILRGFSDESGGLWCPSSDSFGADYLSPNNTNVQANSQYPVLITDQALTSLLGLTPWNLSEVINSQPQTSEASTRLTEIEKQLLWSRRTFHLVWTGEPDTGNALAGMKRKLVLLHVLD